MNPTAPAPSHTIYAWVLGAIVLTLLAVSLSRLAKTKTKADYLVAGRSLPVFVLVFTLLSSWIGSGSLLGGAENAYNHGFAALWQAAGGWAGLLLIYFIAPRARKFAQFTIPDLLEARYNQTARVLGVIAILFAYTAITSYQLIGGGDILHLIFPTVISADLGKYVIAVFVIFFTAIAGMSSVAYMDVAIGLLATIMLILALPLLLNGAGGWSGVTHALPATHFEVLGDFSLIQAFELFLPTLLLMLGNQSMYQKFFSAKSEQDARRAVIGWVAGTVVLETIIVALAVVGSVLFPGGEVHQRPREIIAYTALHGLPVVARSAAHRSGLREDRLDGEQLSLFTGHQSGQRCLYSLYRAQRLRPADSNCLAPGGGPARHRGALPSPQYAVGSGQDTLCIHHLFGSADARDPGRVLLSPRHRCGSGHGHRRRHVRDDLLGHGAGQEPPTPIARPA